MKEGKQFEDQKFVPSTGNCFTVVVLNEFSREDDARTFMNSDMFPEDEVTLVKEGEADFLDLLVMGGFFPSKGQARKAGWTAEMPEGYNEWSIGKLKRCLFYYRPTAANLDESE